MSIIRKVKAVERLFSLLELETTQFQNTSSLHCLSGCGRCCMKPDIEATPLEFLPFAFDLYLKGQAEDYLKKLKEHNSPICTIYNPLTIHDQLHGSCGNYQFRGLICRLFGYAASRDKHGQARLATCSRIKESQSENYEQIADAIKGGLQVPMISDYYQRLLYIDVELGGKLLPINDAIKMALEAILHHYSYRPFPSKLKRVA